MFCDDLTKVFYSQKALKAKRRDREIESAAAKFPRDFTKLCEKRSNWVLLLDKKYRPFYIN